MSIEPTCDFCGYSDKFRCKTQEEADKCDQHVKEKLTRDIRPDHTLPKAEREALPQMTLTQVMGGSNVTVQTHQTGVIERLLVTVEQGGAQGKLVPVSFIIQPNDVEPFIDLLRKARKYTKQGTL